MSTLFDLSGKVAVVTGSSRGIGRSIAEALAEHGAKVVISSRKAEACAEVANAIRDSGGEAIDVPCNVSDEGRMRELVSKTLETWVASTYWSQTPPPTPTTAPFSRSPTRRTTRPCTSIFAA